MTYIRQLSIDHMCCCCDMHDTYVICKLFKKNEPGQRHIFEYGAPFSDEDWSDKEK